jgi:hypothetical protein
MKELVSVYFRYNWRMFVGYILATLITSIFLSDVVTYYTIQAFAFAGLNVLAFLIFALFYKGPKPSYVIPPPIKK